MQVNETHVFYSQDQACKDLLQKIELIASHRGNVLLLGETGTGKEVLAQRIHSWSKRSGPFIAVNCAALPSELVENEFFGAERGAYTGAFQQKVGKFELADFGTLFLDEIGEMPPYLQAKLLRAVEEKSFYRVGGRKVISCNVRIVAATSQPLHVLREKTLRKDFFHRFCFVFSITPLRDRKEDIPLLTGYFLKTICDRDGIPQKQLSPEASSMLEAHHWPGNVRELQNVLERAVVYAEQSPTISTRHITLDAEYQEPSTPLLSRTAHEIPLSRNEVLKLICLDVRRKVLKPLFLELLEENRWNVRRVSRILGFSYSNFLHTLKSYGIRKKDRDKL